MTPAPRTLTSSGFCPTFDSPGPMEHGNHGKGRPSMISTLPRAVAAAAAARSCAGNIEDSSGWEPERAIGERIEVLPLKKRAAVNSSAVHSSNANDAWERPLVMPPKKRHMEYADALGKGKMEAPEDSSPAAIVATVVTAEPPQKKLMNDGILSGLRRDEHHSRQVPRSRRQRPACNDVYGSTVARFRSTVELGKSSLACGGAARSTSGSRPIKEVDETYAPALARKISKKHNNAPAPARKISKKHNNAPAPARKISKKHNNPPAPPPVTSFDEVGGSAALTENLEKIGATTLRYVMRKRLLKSDVHRNQNRLLISCKREVLDTCPITWLLTEDETSSVQHPTEHLPVRTFDRCGNEFAVKLRYLDSNGGYRFISGWGEFLRANGLEIDGNISWTRQVDVELWAFRYRVMDNGKETDVPGGLLGIVMVHYEDREYVEEIYHEMPVRQPKLKQVRVSCSPAVKQEKTVDAEAKLKQLRVSCSPVKQEKTVDVEAEQGQAVESLDITLDDIVLKAGKDMADSLIGLFMLTQL